MSDNESKTYWVSGEIEESIHTALFEVATLIGKHPRKLVEQGVELVIAHYVEMYEKQGKAHEIPAIAKLEVMLRQDRAHQLKLNQVKIMAYNHIQNPTEESADRLSEACELVGVAIETVLEEICDRPQLVEVFTNNGSSLSNAEVFLLSKMKPGEMYAAKDILELGNSQGLRGYVIKEAKRKQGIESVRLEKGWFWRLPPKKLQPRAEESAF